MPGLLSTIKRDYRRYRVTSSESNFLSVVFLTQGFWASFQYRVAHAAKKLKVPMVSQFLKLLMRVWQLLIEITTNIRLPASAKIGDGLYIGYFGPVIIHPDVKIGENCNLSQGVTMGVIQRGKRQGTPILGNRVYVGPNAVIIGDITIGDDVAIGAGAIVTKSVPDRAVVAGNPARILSYKGSFEMISYDGMEDDPDRMQSFAQRETEVEQDDQSGALAS